MAVKTVGSMASGGNIFDDTNPVDVGAKTPGTAIIASRKDHIHAIPEATTGAAGSMSSADKTKLNGLREPLTANRDYYVRTDGNDANTGLVNNAGGAFLTVQKAIDVAATLETMTYDVVINIADGTYVSNTITCKNIIGSGGVAIIGNTTTPENVVVDGGFFKNTPGTVYLTRGMKLIKSSGSAIYGILCQAGGFIYFDKLDFSTGFTYHVYALDGGIVIANGIYTISGGATYHFYSDFNGNIRVDNITVTLTGTPAFSLFAVALTVSVLKSNGVTWTGSATGARFAVRMNGVINTNGAGATYFPGDSAGWTDSATGGQYV